MSSSTPLKDRLDVATNVAVLIAVVAFLALFGQQQYDRIRHAASSAPASLVGQTVTLPGVNFTPQSRTLLLAISTVCHFCKDSEPFYQQLAARNHGQVKMIAVLPQPLAEAQSMSRSPSHLRSR